MKKIIKINVEDWSPDVSHMLLSYAAEINDPATKLKFFQLLSGFSDREAQLFATELTHKISQFI